MDAVNSGPDLPETVADQMVGDPGVLDSAVPATAAGEGTSETPGTFTTDATTEKDPEHPQLPSEPLGQTDVNANAAAGLPEGAVGSTTAEADVTAAIADSAVPEGSTQGTMDGAAAEIPATEDGSTPAVGEPPNPDQRPDDTRPTERAHTAGPQTAETDALQHSLNLTSSEPPNEHATHDSSSAGPDGGFGGELMPAMPDEMFMPPTARTLMSPPPGVVAKASGLPSETRQMTDFTFLHVDYAKALDEGPPLEVVTRYDEQPLEDEEGAVTDSMTSLTENIPMLIPSSPTPSVHGESEVKLGVDVPLTETATQPEPQQARTRSAGNAVVIDREEIIASIRASLDDNEKLKARNVILQNQLGEYFRRKRSDENAQAGGTSSTGDNTLSNTGGGKGGADIGNRYNAALTTLQTLHANLATLRGTHDKQSADYHEKLTLKRAEAAAKEGEFRAYKRSVALAAENSRTGKGIQVKAVEALEAGEERKDAEVVEVRLENIKLRNRLRRSEALLRQKEELADGLHLIDFEQLKIENSTYTSKIESRNESLLTLRKKITTIVQVLTHVKEKLWHTQLVARDLEAKLAELDEDVLRRRDALPGRKAVRDALRKENAELRRRAGLLGEKGLLRDFEHRVDATVSLRQQLTEYQTQHAEYTKHIQALKRHIHKAQILASDPGAASAAIAAAADGMHGMSHVLGGVA